VTRLQALPDGPSLLLEDNELRIGYEVRADGPDLVYELGEAGAQVAAVRDCSLT
jgi:hypothetical protein